MSITKNNPNTVHLAGPKVLVNEYAAGVAITPGMLVELYSDSGVLKVRPNASATEIHALAVAIEQSWQNKGVDDVYAVDDLVALNYLAPGSVIWGLIPSGQNIAVGGLLQSNGNGMLKAATATTEAAGLGHFQALEAVDATALVTARIRVQVIS